MGTGVQAEAGGGSCRGQEPGRPPSAGRACDARTVVRAPCRLGVRFPLSSDDQGFVPAAVSVALSVFLPPVPPISSLRSVPPAVAPSVSPHPPGSAALTEPLGSRLAGPLLCSPGRRPAEDRQQAGLARGWGSSWAPGGGAGQEGGAPGCAHAAPTAPPAAGPGEVLGLGSRSRGVRSVWAKLVTGGAPLGVGSQPPAALLPALHGSAAGAGPRLGRGREAERCRVAGPLRGAGGAHWPALPGPHPEPLTEPAPRTDPSPQRGSEAIFRAQRPGRALEGHTARSPEAPAQPAPSPGRGPGLVALRVPRGRRTGWGLG